MAARTITITLSDDQERILAACFGRPGAPLEVDKVQQVLRLSLDSWLGVFSGARRYRSLTELYLDWLEQIYATLLTAAKPTSTYLYQRLNFSFGAASYLTRVLLSKEQSHWRELRRPCNRGSVCRGSAAPSRRTWREHHPVSTTEVQTAINFFLTL